LVSSVQYEVVKKLFKVEVRRYHRIVTAKVSNFEPDSFGLLFRFISGNNIEKEKVKMTSPVVSQSVSQEIKIHHLLFLNSQIKATWRLLCLPNLRWRLRRYP